MRANRQTQDALERLEARKIADRACELGGTKQPAPDDNIMRQDPEELPRRLRDLVQAELALRKRRLDAQIPPVSARTVLLDGGSGD